MFKHFLKQFISISVKTHLYLSTYFIIYSYNIVLLLQQLISIHNNRKLNKNILLILLLITFFHDDGFFFKMLHKERKAMYGKLSIDQLNRSNFYSIQTNLLSK